MKEKIDYTKLTNEIYARIQADEKEQNPFSAYYGLTLEDLTDKYVNEYSKYAIQKALKILKDQNKIQCEVLKVYNHDIYFGNVYVYTIKHQYSIVKKKSNIDNSSNNTIKTERLKVLLTNAITVIEEQLSYGESNLQEELGITHEEYVEIMGGQE